MSAQNLHPVLERADKCSEVGAADKSRISSLSDGACIAGYETLVAAIAGVFIPIERRQSALGVYTDGVRMLAPAAPAFGDERDFVCALIIQSMLVRNGALNRSIVGKLLGHEAAAARYLWLETVRCASSPDSVIPRWLSKRITTCAVGAASASTGESLQRALKDKGAIEAPAWCGKILPGALLSTKSDLLGATASARDLRRAEKNVVADETEDDEESERSRILSLLSSPINSKSPLTDFLKALFGAKGADNKSQQPAAGGEMPAASVRWVKKIGSAAKIIQTALGGREAPFREADGFIYPEWDQTQGAYRDDWCQVLHFEIPSGSGLNPAFPDQMLRRRLARLGTTYKWQHRQHDGDSLDDDAMLRFRVDVASGYSGDDRVYQSSRKFGRGLSALVLLDASGSTGDASAHGKSVWDAQRQLAMNAVAALDDLGDTVAAYGFRSFGRSDVRFLRIVEFGGRFDQRARARLHALRPTGFTRLGAAIRHSAHLLAGKARTEHQLLILVSDGHPYDTGYEHAYADNDVRRALHEVQALGVACVCISVGSHRDEEMLLRLWGDVGQARLDAPSDLNGCALELFSAALKRAATAKAPSFSTAA